MKECEALCTTDYSIIQTTLEQIFIHLTGQEILIKKRTRLSSIIIINVYIYIYICSYSISLRVLSDAHV